MDEVERLLIAVEKYMAKRKLTPRRFGELACKDARFVFDLRRGRQPGRDRVKKVRAFMRGPAPKPSPMYEQWLAVTRRRKRARKTATKGAKLHQRKSGPSAGETCGSAPLASMGAAGAERAAGSGMLAPSLLP